MSLPIAALPVIKELITAAANYQMCKEHETTERLKLEAQLEACLTAINANQANFSYLWDYDNLLEEKDSPFDKGKDVFEELYKNRIRVR